VLSKYSSIIFDCDGVVLNSNKLKSLAFYDTVKEFGENSALQLYNYHLQNGGISRYAKFEYFVNEILETPINANVKMLLSKFSSIVSENLLKCEVLYGIEDLRSGTNGANWSIVSGGDQAELNTIFQNKGIHHFFNDGIFGSPATKYEIIRKQLAEGKYVGKTLFLGDSKLDFEVASYFGFDFVFVSQWSEMENWEVFCEDNNILSISSPIEILNVINFEK
jgi:phosphoglycolate phosphatase-like HAD superfamily hydrolase